MISSLVGTVEDLANQTVTVNVNGVGYEVHCTASCLARLVLGAKATLVIYTDVKEDSIRLYGFDDKLEKHVFLLLTKVKGVGAKSAADILSQIDKLELLRVIGSADTTRLQSVRGIGRKIAERIIVELKDRVSDFVNESSATSPILAGSNSGPFYYAMEAMIALGFPRKEAERAVREVEKGGGSESDPGQIVREALRFV